VAGQLVSAGVEAVEVLRDSLRAQSGTVRLRAAQLILVLGSQLRHAQELEARLVALEASGTQPVADAMMTMLDPRLLERLESRHLGAQVGSPTPLPVAGAAHREVRARRARAGLFGALLRQC
jgi:hypothetical protein